MLVYEKKYVEDFVEVSGKFDYIICEIEIEGDFSED